MPESDAWSVEQKVSLAQARTVKGDAREERARGVTLTDVLKQPEPSEKLEHGLKEKRF